MVYFLRILTLVQMVAYTPKFSLCKIPPPRKQLTGTSLMNERFKGIGIKVNDKYDFLFYARTLKDGTK